MYLLCLFFLSFLVFSLPLAFKILIIPVLFFTGPLGVFGYLVPYIPQFKTILSFMLKILKKSKLLPIFQNINLIVFYTKEQIFLLFLYFYYPFLLVYLWIVKTILLETLDTELPPDPSINFLILYYLSCKHLSYVYLLVFPSLLYPPVGGSIPSIWIIFSRWIHLQPRTQILLIKVYFFFKEITIFRKVKFLIGGKPGL